MNGCAAGLTLIEMLETTRKRVVCSQTSLCNYTQSRDFLLFCIYHRLSSSGDTVETRYFELAGGTKNCSK